jgi:CBS domain-containing protein
MRQWNQIAREIELSTDLVQLRSLRDNFHDAFDAAPSLQEHPMELINKQHDAFIQRTLAMTEQRVRASYAGAPPVSSFTFLLFGSGGRKEQTLWSDQDNGMVYVPEEGAPIDEVERYMHELAAAFRQALEEVRYPPCEGDVLISNPIWRRSLADWRATLREWFEQPQFGTVRYLLIMADARSIYGNDMLAPALRTEFMDQLDAHRAILPRMLQNTLRYKVLVGLLGNLLTERYGEDAGGIDIKYGAYIPMVNAIRLLALGQGITASSTLERLEALKQSAAVKAELVQDWEYAFQVVLRFRAMTPFQLEDGKYTTRGIVSAKMLTKEVKRELKQALRIGADLQRHVKRTFGTEGRL